jgi:hypothetical protein
MKPNIPNKMPAFIAAFSACETENELLIKSQTKNTRPPNIPINKQESIAYDKFILMKINSSNTLNIKKDGLNFNGLYELIIVSKVFCKQ